MNFIRLFYDDHSVYGVYPPLNDNIIKITKNMSLI